jgi:hypothetical protein
MDIDIFVKSESEGIERKYCDNCAIWFPEDYTICAKCGAILGYRTAGLITGDIVSVRLTGPDIWTPSELPFIVLLPDAEAGIIRDRIGAPSKSALREFLTRSEKYNKRRYFVDIPPESIIGKYPSIKAADIKDKI